MGNLKNNILSRKKPPGLSDANEVFTSGESARYSGLYKVEHGPHEVEQEIFIQKGTKLPLCQDCGNPIKFRLVKEINSITEDPDFR